MHVQYINSRSEMYRVLEEPPALELENQTEIALHYWIVKIDNFVCYKHPAILMFTMALVIFD